MGGVLSSVKYTPDGIPYHTLNDFKDLKKLLVCGGYSTVYKGYAIKTGFTRKKQVVAIKSFNAADIYTEREIQIIKKHPHPNIVELFGVIWDGDVVYNGSSTKTPIYTGYVMEYMEMGSLHRVIHDLSEHYDMKLIKQWIKQIGHGLEYLHGNGIIHRDIKPHNILLAARDHLKLADFGLARSISSTYGYTSGPKGTDPYMAPEVIGIRKDYGPPADVYSFGITIWEDNLLISKDVKGNDCVELPIDQMDDDSLDFLERCWRVAVSERPSLKEIICLTSTVGDTILIIGGDNYTKNLILSHGRTSWIETQLKLPYKGMASGAVYLNGEIYFIGGTRNPKALHKLDKTLKWIRLADMNSGRSGITNSCLEWNGYIWVLGGWDAEMNRLKSVERYDPEEDSWTLMPDMKYPRSSAAAVLWYDSIIICGGFDGDKTMNTVECFNHESGWKELPQMPVPLHNHSFFAFQTKLIVMGRRGRLDYIEEEIFPEPLLLPDTADDYDHGIADDYDHGENFNNAWVFDPLEIGANWKPFEKNHCRCSCFTGIVLGKELYTFRQIGPISESKKFVNLVFIFNGEYWEVGPRIPYSRDAMPSIFSIVIPQSLADRLCLYRSQ